MASARSRKVVLDDWCAKCAEVASSLAGRDLAWEAEGNISRFPCPLSDGRHAWKGDDPQAWAIATPAGIKAGCRKCAPKGSNKEAEYTHRVAEAIGWSDPTASERRQGAVTETLRHHDYMTLDRRFVVRHSKLRRGADTWWGFSWRSADQKGAFEYFEVCGKGDLKAFQEEHYPAVRKTYQMVRFYKDELFHFDGRRKDVYRVAVLEGEKDADTFNELMTSVDAGIIGTALPTQNLLALAPHQEEIIDGHDLIIVPDDDSGGETFSSHWISATWGRARSVKIFPSSTFNGGDFSEWVEGQRLLYEDHEIAEELLKAMTQTAAVTEQPEAGGAWRSKLRQTQKGSVVGTNLYNATVIWSEHPELAGRVRRNIMSGEIESTDLPWGDSVQGAHHLSKACSAWLDGEENITITAKALEDALGVPSVAPDHNPFELAMAEVWDGVARLDALFTRYIPLGVEPGQAMQLARIVYGDLLAKMRGERVQQRVLIGIGTRLDVDIAGAMAPNAMHHRGRVGNMATLARACPAMVQLDMEAVSHRTIAPTNVPVIFGNYVLHRNSDRRLPSPYCISVGTLPTGKLALWEVNDRVFLLEMVGQPRLDELALDSPQLLAEGLVRFHELQSTVVPDKSELRTMDEVRRLETTTTMVRVIVDFATRDIPIDRVVDPQMVRRADLLPTPRRHLVRDQIFHVMRACLMDEWNKTSDWIAAWSVVRSHFQLTKQVTLTIKIAKELNWSVDFRGERKIAITGIYLSDSTLGLLTNWLHNHEDS